MTDQPDPGIEALVAAFYAAFDNRGSRTPDASGLRAMFADGATITRVAGDQVETWTPQAFIAPRVAILTDGTLTDFHEWETQARTVVLENIASRWSSYAKSGTLDGAPYAGGGQKLLQFFRKDGRWLIGSILWEDS